MMRFRDSNYKNNKDQENKEMNWRGRKFYVWSKLNYIQQMTVLYEPNFVLNLIIYLG